MMSKDDIEVLTIEDLDNIDEMIRIEFETWEDEFTYWSNFWF